MGEPIEFKTCKEKAEAAEDISVLLEYMKDSKRPLRHTRYFHYTKMAVADSILSKGELWFSRLGDNEFFNDGVEQQHYQKKYANTFSLCFCTGTSESLPLWYLYSGTDGKGARLSWGSVILKELKALEKVYLFEVDEDSNEIDGKARIELQKGDFEVSFGDILYLGKDAEHSGKHRVKYGSGCINGISEQNAERIRQEYDEYLKGLIWFYEKETRVQIRVLGQPLDLDKHYKIAVPFSDTMWKNLKVTLAPEFDVNEKGRLLDNCGFRKYALQQLQMSDYAGQISMHLPNCTNCEKKTGGTTK